ncbi:MAG: hypothetical protein KA250_04340 [Verrucomicrobiales bacterium]|nr:hypothetical protein [Verrucomicrobiales bacterium]MBP9225279.1 hypothetical protein [Verrucomicrobiales bacterium]HQZ27245.1 hypothetical protein [Verrucomicrobiales bacterium]
MKQTNTANRPLVLAERPEGAPTESTLTLETEEVLSTQPCAIPQRQVHWLSWITLKWSNST